MFVHVVVHKLWLLIFQRKITDSLKDIYITRVQRIKKKDLKSPLN